MPKRTYYVKNDDFGSIIGRGKRNIPVADGCGLAVQQVADRGYWGKNVHMGMVFNCSSKTLPSPMILCHHFFWSWSQHFPGCSHHGSTTAHFQYLCSKRNNTCSGK